MNIEKRIELALKISEGIENGKISPNNLYDLLLHLSEAMSQVKNLTIPVVSHQRELLNLKTKSKHKKIPKDNAIGYIIQKEC